MAASNQKSLHMYEHMLLCEVIGLEFCVWAVYYHNMVRATPCHSSKVLRMELQATTSYSRHYRTQATTSYSRHYRTQATTSYSRHYKTHRLLLAIVDTTKHTSYY